MTSQSTTHRPTDPTRFDFDASVIRVFDDMADRSIPGYGYAHARITDLIKRNEAVLDRNLHVWDFGTTTARGLQAVKDGFPHPFVHYHGCDISPAAVEQARRNMPWAEIVQHDLTEGLPVEAEPHIGKTAVALFGWTLQFLRDKALRNELIADAYRLLAPGGMLFIMEKFDTRSDFAGDATSDAYYAWRRDNGYPLTAIEAKSGALANSMWPWTRTELEAAVQVKCPGARHDWLYQLYGFGALVVVKPLDCTFRQ